MMMQLIGDPSERQTTAMIAAVKQHERRVDLRFDSELELIGAIIAAARANYEEGNRK
jgi:hypothetical protein